VNSVWRESKICFWLMTSSIELAHKKTTRRPALFKCIDLQITVFLDMTLHRVVMCTLPPSTSIRMSHVEKSSQWHKPEEEKSLGLKTHQWDNLVALKRGCRNPNYHTHHSYWSESLFLLVYTLFVLCLQLIYPGDWCSRFLHNINIHLSDDNGIPLQKTAQQSSVTTVTIEDFTH